MTEEEKKKKAAQDAASAANVPTYAEFVAQNENIGVSPVNIQQPITYGEGNKTALQLIEEQKNASYAAAQAQRERAIIDAKTSYAQNFATYGKNAEALAGSGLGGSGYGEYLGASAYAQQRADIQAAKAAESAAKNAADRVYYADMAAQTEKANAAYLHLLDLAKDGGYTAEEIRSMAQKQGITSEEDLGMLGKTAGEEVTNTTISKITADTTDEEISDMIVAGTLSTEKVQAAKEARTEAALDNVEMILNSGDVAGAEAEIEKYHESGAVGTDEYQNYFFQKNLDAIEKDDASGTLTAKSAIAYEQTLEKAKKDGKISNVDYETLMSYLYSNITTVVDGATVEFERRARGKDKTFFSVNMNGEVIDTASFGAEADSRTKNALTAVAGENPSEGTLALYDDGVYVYINSYGYSGWYKASRDWFKEGAISALDNKRIYDIIKNDIAPKNVVTARPKHKADE